jgi:hypothetical protein
MAMCHLTRTQQDSVSAPGIQHLNQWKEAIALPNNHRDSHQSPPVHHKDNILFSRYNSTQLTIIAREKTNLTQK